MNIGLIFKSAQVAMSVAELTAVLKGFDAKVDRLVKSDLNAGLRMLDQAAIAITQQVSLLQEARTYFT